MAGPPLTAGQMRAKPVFSLEVDSGNEVQKPDEYERARSPPTIQDMDFDQYLGEPIFVREERPTSGHFYCHRQLHGKDTIMMSDRSGTPSKGIYVSATL